MRTVKVTSLTEQQRTWLEKESTRTGLPMSMVIKMLINEGIKRGGEQHPQIEVLSPLASIDWASNTLMLFGHYPLPLDDLVRDGVNTWVDKLKMQTLGSDINGNPATGWTVNGEIRQAYYKAGGK